MCDKSYGSFMNKENLFNGVGIKLTSVTVRQSLKDMKPACKVMAPAPLLLYALHSEGKKVRISQRG